MVATDLAVGSSKEIGSRDNLSKGSSNRFDIEPEKGDGNRRLWLVGLIATIVVVGIGVFRPRR
jgi:hypothetical protein